MPNFLISFFHSSLYTIKYLYKIVLILIRTIKFNFYLTQLLNRNIEVALLEPFPPQSVSNLNQLPITVCHGNWNYFIFMATPII